MGRHAGERGGRAVQRPSPSLLLTFPVTVIKYPDKKQLREKGIVWAHCSKLHGGQLKVVGSPLHPQSGGRKGVNVFSLFYSPGSQPWEWCYPRWLGLSPSCNLITIPPRPPPPPPRPRHIQRAVSKFLIELMPILRQRSY